MKDLVEFLRARLDEDEEQVRNVFRPKPDAPAHSLQPDWDDPDVALVTAEVGGRVRMTWHEYNERFEERAEPDKRKLAEVAAKRRIIEAYQQREAAGHPVTDCHATGLLLAIRWLALPYTDHPDYREEWRP